MTSDDPQAALRRTIMAGMARLLGGIAIPATVILPLLLFRTRALSDAALSTVAVLFLLRSALLGDWRWSRAAWFQCALAVWALITLSSAWNGPASSFVEGALSIRFFVFCAAVANWTLAGPRARNATGTVCALLAGWTVLECWQQYLTGTNIFGYTRWEDGALTGPFFKPRAGNALLMVLFPGAMPVVLGLLGSDAWRRRGIGVLCLLILIATMILIGQRMANLLMLAGLVLSALLVRGMRLPVLGALALGGVLLVSLPVVSPPTYAKLVVKFTDQITHFSTSPYGQIYTRAGVMVMDHPWLGVGFDGFRFQCLNPRYLRGLPTLGVPFVEPPELGCNIHPHNYYLQVATAAGVPGLLLFLGMIGFWLRTITRPFLPSWKAERVSEVPAAPLPTAANAMLVVACCLTVWPFASTSTLFSPPPGGWVFLIAGWALAVSRPPRRR